MTAKTVKLGLIQMRMETSYEANLAHAISMLEEAATKGVQVACLPELFLGPYFCQKQDPAIFDMAEPIPGRATEALNMLARKTGMVIIGSIFEKRAPGLYHNTATVHEADGTLAGIYRKMHIPDDPLYFEKYYFTPGDLGFKSFATSKGINVGTLVCWDQWYPEAARLTALKGADVLCYPTAIGWHPKEKAEFGQAQVEAWVGIQRGHAIANGVFVAAANRVGHEKGVGDGIEFFGNSFIFDPFGRPLARASQDKEEVLIAELDLSLIEDTRRNWPFLRDRRVDAFGGITSRWAE